MALPKIDTPTYETKLPSTNETIKYRPFLVKEQKVLMMAQESKDENQIKNAMIQLVSSCTFDKVDAANAPLFDVEHLFLRLRAASVGEKIKVKVTCPDDNRTEVVKEINLADIDSTFDVTHSNIIELTPQIKLEMTYPTIGNSQNNSASETATVFKMLDSCIGAIHHGDTVHKRIDISKKEMSEFIGDLGTAHLESIMVFFQTMPKLRHVVEVTNPKTKVKSEVLLEGLNTFLA